MGIWLKTRTKPISFSTWTMAGRTIRTRGDQNVAYADIVAGDEGITMMVRIKGGRDARIECPMFIFQNQGRSYPIRNVPDNVPGVCIGHSQRDGWTKQHL